MDKGAPTPAQAKKLSKGVQKLVDKGEAAVDPAGEDLVADSLQGGELVWGEYRDDGVWYPGTVKRRGSGGDVWVHFDDGDEDDKPEGRRWRTRVDEPSSKRQRSDNQEVPEEITAADAAAVCAATRRGLLLQQ